MSLDALDSRDAALLVIDMQNAFLHPEGTLGVSGVDTRPLAAIVPVLADLVQCFQGAGIPVIWTVQDHFARDASRGRMRLAPHTARRRKISCLSGSWDAEIVDELQPLARLDPRLIIRKHRFGAFHGTRLAPVLRMLGTRILFLAGTTANACVETSLREAYLRDLDAVAITDCISGVNPGWAAAAREVWEQYFCITADSGRVLEWIHSQTRPRVIGPALPLLAVEDLERSMGFYGGRLGLRAGDARPLADGRMVTPFEQGLGLVPRREEEPRRVPGLAFEVNDLRSLREDLRTHGVKIQQDLHQGLRGETLCVLDPEGNPVELFQAEVSAS